MTVSTSESFRRVSLAFQATGFQPVVVDLERLPGYAPDLNPTEGIWKYLKYVELKNLCCHNLPEVHYELRKAVARLRHKTDVILSCIQHVHLGEKV